MTNKPSGLHSHTGYWLDRLRAEVHVAFERAVEAEGVTVAQWCVLVAVVRGDAATPQELARHIAIDSGAVTRLVDRLVAKDLLRRVPSARDRRSVTLAPTPAAAALVPRLSAIADANDARFFGVISAAEHRAFRQTLAKLLAAASIEVAPSWLEHGPRPPDVSALAETDREP